VCTDCGGTVIEYDAAAGNGFCVSCGTVIEENTIVNEVSFGETSTGAAMVQGAYVGQGASVCCLLRLRAVSHRAMQHTLGWEGRLEIAAQTSRGSRPLQTVRGLLRSHKGAIVLNASSAAEDPQHC
jgi:transcription factor IIIB subunit 2